MLINQYTRFTRCDSRTVSQDSTGNTAGHRAVLHFSNANMFNFLAGLYQKGYGRFNTQALYDAPHARLARAIAGLSELSTDAPELDLCVATPRKQVADRVSSEDYATAVEAVGVAGGASKRSASACAFRSIAQDELRQKPPAIFAAAYCHLDFGDNSSILPPGGQPASSSVAAADTNEPDAKKLIERIIAFSTQFVEAPSVDSCGWTQLFSVISEKIAALHAAATVEIRLRTAAFAFIQAYVAEVEATPRPQLLDLLNDDGLTPFTLAGRQGKRAIVEALWHRNSKLAWAWGGIKARTYPLDQVDDIGQVSAQIVDALPEYRTDLRFITRYAPPICVLRRLLTRIPS